MLRRFLERSITMAGVCGDVYDEAERTQDIQDLDSIQAKFIGRAAFWWNTTYDTREDSLHFARTYVNTRRLLAQDSTLIVQGAVFEFIRGRNETTSSADRIRIPGWVLRAWGQKPDTVRYFVSANIAFVPNDTLDPTRNDRSQVFEVPDVTRLEARMWLYYRACSYLATGIEALHLGQMQLMARKDESNDYAATRELLDKIRRFAQEGAPGFAQPNGLTGTRRKWVVLDCHSKRLIRSRGQDLFDFYSMPVRSGKLYTSANTKSFYSEGVYGTEMVLNSCGTEESLYQDHEGPGLFLVELDNGLSSRLAPDIRPEFVMWGWDEISWFGSQPAAYRADWLRYVHRWLACNDPQVLLQMPGRRGLSLFDENKQERHPQYRFNGTQLEKKRIREIWEGRYDSLVPLYSVPDARAARSLTIEADGAIYWVDSTTHTIESARWNAAAPVPGWVRSRVGAAADAAGDLVVEYPGSLFYRTLKNQVEYYKLDNATQRWVHYSTGGPANVGGHLVFENAGTFLNPQITPTLYYRSLDGRLEYLQFVDSTSTWAHQRVRRVRVDDTPGAIVSVATGVVACIAGRNLRVFERRGQRWTNQSPWDGKNDVQSHLVWYKEREQPHPLASQGRFYYRTVTNDLGANRYDHVTHKWDSFSYADVLNVGGDIIVKDPAELLYRTTDHRIASLRWGCPEGAGQGPGWVPSTYVGVQNCYQNLVRQRDNSFFFLGPQSTVHYLTWEGIKCLPPRPAVEADQTPDAGARGARREKRPATGNE
ncbi:hypothetical protein LGH70_02160 [Hymenobacter sp. BT635]|uniref:Uncharacterized protein n=1 Tax=Hymenobacter nitidus TaxID=2880929 RepID=A0ABS8A7J7_9BACT|nr:hypothetical protein [Hymenobacter nitidus]MCB2376368.1 hypothetical protein [Hymenobacter nitidus]